ncbi:TPA: helix-turn-helix transcriptional regulator [Serratia marcescens]
MENFTFIICGNDFYFSYGLEYIFNSECNNLNLKAQSYHEKEFHVWNLSGTNLTGIISFVRKRTTMPKIIFCDKKYIDFFKRIYIFQNVEIMDSHSSIAHIRKKLSYVIGLNSILRKQSNLSTPYTSVKQMNVALNILQGNSTQYCAMVMSMSIKSISFHKRKLMRHLRVHNNQELIATLWIIESFNQPPPIFSNCRRWISTITGDE